MGKTNIEWADFVFNPWLGCDKVSPACDKCYAEAWAKRAGREELWAGERKRTTPQYWRQPILWNKRARESETRPRVFCASLADVFDNQAEPQWRADLWALIAMTPHLDWLLLTKRPQNIAKMLPTAYGFEMMAGTAWPWPNVWLGATAENQREYDRRWKHVAKIPAAVRFVSYEPALGPLVPHGEVLPDWIICGGESGGNPRMMPPDHARAMRDFCATRDIAFFMKQMTGKTTIPPDLLIRQFPTSRGIHG